MFRSVSGFDDTLCNYQVILHSYVRIIILLKKNNVSHLCSDRFLPFFILLDL